MGTLSSVGEFSEELLVEPRPHPEDDEKEAADDTDSRGEKSVKSVAFSEGTEREMGLFVEGVNH